MTMNVIIIMCRNVVATFMLQTVRIHLLSIYFACWTENDKLNPMCST